MIKHSFLLLMFFLATQIVSSQSVLKGKIITNETNLGEIYIVNTTINEKTMADKDGLFSILGKSNHVLIISGEKIEKRTIFLKETDFYTTIFNINVYPRTKQLTEVVVQNYPKISAISLGVVYKDVKSYTPAERKIKTAGKFKWYSPLLIPFGGMSVDGLLNKISGRTKMLKKELVVENLEKNQLKLTNLFLESFYTEILGIPKENLNGFIIYACETSEISIFLKENNSIKVRYALIDLSVKYKEIIFVK
jgi:hypothetical protein